LSGKPADESPISAILSVQLHALDTITDERSPLLVDGRYNRIHPKILVLTLDKKNDNYTLMI